MISELATLLAILIGHPPIMHIISFSTSRGKFPLCIGAYRFDIFEVNGVATSFERCQGAAVPHSNIKRMASVLFQGYPSC